MKVLIAGVGGVGGYIGAKLIQHTNAKVTLLARGANFEAIEKNGLKVIENNEEFVVKPFKVTQNPQKEGIFDFIIIAVKSYDLEPLLEQLKNNVNEKMIILPLLNGVEHDLIIKKYYPNAKVLKGCIYIISHLKEPGVIEKKGKVFKLCWGGNIDETSKEEIAKLFDTAKLRHKFTKEIDYEIWKKFLFISAMAALTTYYKTTMDIIASKHNQELQELFTEIVTLAQKKGVSLTNQEIEAALTQASKVIAGAKTSMQLDFEKGKKSEIDSLLGFVVKESKKLRLQAHLMEKIYNSLKENL